MAIAKIANIKIDMPREKRVGTVVANFFRKKGYKVIEETLTVGDIIIELDTGIKLFIERKTIQDWFSSYSKKNGKSRLRNQAIELNKRKYSAIMVYGNPLRVKNVNPGAKHFTINSFYKMQANIMLNYKVPVFYTPGGEVEFLSLLDSTIKSFQKHVLDDIKVEDTLVKSATNNIGVNILSSYPGIAEKKAQLLLDKFGSCEKVFKANDKEILAINGVGKGLLGKIRKLEKEFKGK